MRSFLAKHFSALRRCDSGNALMIVALGMPVLLGGTGLAVDTSQWYMWKGELQYAADQAAIAGAWARTKAITENSYDDRAAQEFAANLQYTDAISTDPQVSLEDWAAGHDNSVVVTASATKKLPFSYFLTGRSATVTVSAQAAYTRGVNVDSCLVAVDEHEDGAITIGGSAEFIAGCGIKALSDAGSLKDTAYCEEAIHATELVCSGEAISVNGNPTIHAGTLIAEGAIDDWFDTPSANNINNTPIPYADELHDNFADLNPPETSQTSVARSYDCPKGKTTSTYVADSVTTRKEITYSYWTKSGNTYTSYSYTGSAKKTNVDNTSTQTNVTLSALPASSTVVQGPTESGYVQVDLIGSGNNKTKIYEKSVTKTTTTYVNARLLTSAEDGGAAVLLPGTYSNPAGDLKLKCDTVFTSGIYVLDGVTLDISSQYDVTGAGVMFVLKNGAGFSINGGANVNLTAMTVAELETAGVSHAEAVKLDGMLIFEDRHSSGNTKIKLNGNASTILNGTVYLPVSNLDIQGSAGVTTQCLLIVASTITITGNVEMDSFCPPNETSSGAQAEQLPSTVRLVS